jgi:hypothetical protein
MSILPEPAERRRGRAFAVWVGCRYQWIEAHRVVSIGFYRGVTRVT